MNYPQIDHFRDLGKAIAFLSEIGECDRLLYFVEGASAFFTEG